MEDGKSAGRTIIKDGHKALAGVEQFGFQTFQLVNYPE